MPTHRHGTPLAAPAGASFVSTLADPDAPSTHREQHLEQLGHRGFYRDGWEVVTLHQPLTPFTDDEWELYDLASDPNELHDLSAEHPDKRRELAEAWESAAWANRVYPLDEGIGDQVPPAARTQPRVRHAGDDLRGDADARALAVGAADLVPHAHDPRRPRLRAAATRGTSSRTATRVPGTGSTSSTTSSSSPTTTAAGACARCRAASSRAGTREIVAELLARGSQVWTVTLAVDGERRGTLDGVPMLFGMAPFEGIDVGIDRRSPVSWEIYERFGPFPFTGALHVGPVRAGRAGARRPRGDDGRVAGDGRQVRVTTIRVTTSGCVSHLDMRG